MSEIELTKKIYNDYPKTNNKIIEYFENKLKEHKYYSLYANVRQHFIREPHRVIKYPFNMLYGLLDEFFRQYDIFLIDFLNNLLKNYLFINSKKELKKNNIYEKYQQRAILKACKILKAKLESEEK